MKAVYVKYPFETQIRDVELPKLENDQVLINIKACGLCGADLVTMSTPGEDWQPLGHEIAGIVEAVGNNVDNVKVGDKVALESTTFCRTCDTCRNGKHVHCNKGPNLWVKPAMGFSEKIIVRKELCVPFEGISFEQAAMVEPMGVALDLCEVADIKLNDEVLIVGLGPIGLMTVKFAKLMGARKVYVAELSTSPKRIEIAKKFGADEVILTDKISLEEFDFPKGGVDKILVTAPPKLIEKCIKLLNFGGILSFIGIQYGNGANITFDANEFHFKRLQLRASHASPAFFFPKCIEMIKSGMINPLELITAYFPMEKMQEYVDKIKNEKQSHIKVMMTR